MTKIKNIVLFAFILLAVLAAFGNAGGTTGLDQTETGEEVFFTILHTNDEHSALIPTPAVDFHPEKENPTRGGFARLAGLINQIREEKEAKDEEVLLLNGGDFYGGTVYGWLALEGHAPELKLMQQMGYDIVAIGNHEYDNGPYVLADYLKNAGYPGANEKTVLLATNTLIPSHHPLYEADIRDTYIKKMHNGLRIGFFSIIGDDAKGVTVETDPLKFSDRDETARAAVAALGDEDVDLIVAVNHAGITEDRELAENVDGIDIIVGGHSHTDMYEPEIINDTVIVQAGGCLDYLGILELAYNPATGEVRPRNDETRTPHLAPLDHTAPVDPEISAAVDDYTGLADRLISRITGGQFRSILDPIAMSDFTLPNKPDNAENEFGNFITDAMRSTVEEITGEKVDFAFQGSGIIRSSIIPGEMEYSRGQISLYDLMEAVALGSGPDGSPGFPLAAAYLTGDEIRRILEISLLASQHMGDNYFLQVSGLRFAYDPDRVIMFPIPGTNLPFPSVRAILNAEVYTGEGRQTGEDNDYAPLKWGDDELYHVVTDYALMSIAVEEAARQLPWLAINPKDIEGNVIEDPEDFIVRTGGEEELKVWQSVLYYMADQSPGPEGYPLVDSYYADTAGRITATSDTGPLAWIYMFFNALYIFLKPVLIAVAAIVIVIILVRRHRGRSSGEQGAKGKV